MKKLLVLAVLLLVSACGIKPTPVLGAGPAPTLRNPVDDGPGMDVTLYFVRDGRVAPVTRPGGFPVTVQSTLAMLLAGPTSQEEADGYTTALPQRPGGLTVSAGPPATIDVSFPLRLVTGAGINQLVCTAFAALVLQGGNSVDGTIALAGPDVRLPYQTCQA
ncbi:hypothetical protein [Amycolatopsis vancoresmycina]|uniref:GerMN domain-containing protein n=1 Tax=Amycolatopsis vancoresmycina DSM 44592 TaxID=1292037 RepID=R1G125_9PSEU|nr:hypothetical protein [Amycolatopsis vancoresmycina]EOD65212.1 hypothetical protein H480_27811 [Amycolatopsis vancoresmycina DSM 44592]